MTKQSSQSLFWFLVAVVFAVGGSMLLVSYMVTAPGNVVNELGGDCGKNYFTFLYHSIYGKGVWFRGMNYPYGDHIIYADGQPVLSTFLHLFQPLNPHYALAAMNLLLSLSYVAAILFTYKILLHFEVKQFIAVLFACLIVLLSPQVFRLRSHFGLAYVCPVPMLFYWNLLYHHTQKWRYPACIFIMGTVVAFMHLYLGAIIFIWVAFYFIGCLVFVKGSLKKRLRFGAPVLVAAICLFIYIKAFIALTDPVTDRPAFPVNSLDTITHILDIFSSPYSPVWMYIRDKNGFKNISTAGEGYTYIGITAILIILITIIAGLVNRIKGRKDPAPLVSENKFSPVWLFIGLGALLVATGAPFTWHMQWLLEYMSIFKQFRAMGRFSWIFYFITTVFAVVALNSLYLKSIAANMRAVGYVMLVAALLVWGYEVKGYMDVTRGFIAAGRKTADEFFYKNETKWPEYLAEHHYKADDFQAILLLPLFVSGSEKLWVGGDPSWPLSIGMRASIELHLPIVDVMMSRTSWSQTEKQVKTAAGPYADKPMLRDLKSNKPFLVIWHDGQDIDQDEAYLLKAADFIDTHYQSHIYACYPDRIIANDKKNRDSINKILAHMPPGDTCLVNRGPWVISHFDTKRSPYVFFGKGACKPILQDDSVILDTPFRVAADRSLYELSGWVFLDTKDYRSPTLTLKQFDSTGREVASDDAITAWCVDNYNMWFRPSKYFYILGATRSLKIILNNNPKPTYLAFDELQLRPADAVIISKGTDGKVLVNNHLLIPAPLNEK